jgi:hypothetical protein
MLTRRRGGIVHILDIEPADPVVQLPRQAREPSRWHSKQRLHLVCGQLNSELQTGAGRVPKEVSPETRVRQQAAERPFHVTLTHASYPVLQLARIAPSVPALLTGSFRCGIESARAAAHVNV